MQSNWNWMRPATVCLLCLAFPFVLFAQAPPSNPAVPTLKVTTHLVVLNVVVTDKKGKPVTNLSKDDFSVLENGQPQTISAFEPAAQPGGAEGAHVPPDFVPAVALQNGTPRTIIVLDELNTVSEDTMFAKQKMRQFLLAQPAVLSQPTSIYLLTKRRLEQFAAPTRDRDSLLAKLSKMSLELPPHDLDSGSVQGGADRLLASLLALDEIALSTAEQKTRKNVIWIGNGIPILSASGVSLGDSERFKNWVHYTANWLEETQTTVYTIDPRGLETAEVGIYNDTGRYIVPTPDLTPSELLFESIAPESGGAIMRGRNDIDVAIETAVRDGNSYYTLSYYPTDRNWDGNFRKIRIQLEPAGLIARTQRGYYAYADGFQNGAGQVEFGLSRAVTSPLPFHSVAFAATGERLIAPSPGRSTATPQAARVILSIDRDGLSWTPQPNGGQRAEITLVTSEISSSGRVLAYKVHEVEVLLAKSQLQGAFANDPAKLSVRMDLPAKTDHIRLVVRDSDSGHLGTFDLAAGSLVAANVSSPR